MVIPAQFLNQNFHEIFVYHFLKMEGKEYIISNSVDKNLKGFLYMKKITSIMFAAMAALYASSDSSVRKGADFAKHLDSIRFSDLRSMDSQELDDLQRNLEEEKMSDPYKNGRGAYKAKIDEWFGAIRDAREGNFKEVSDAIPERVRPVDGSRVINMFEVTEEQLKNNPDAAHRFYGELLDLTKSQSYKDQPRTRMQADKWLSWLDDHGYGQPQESAFDAHENTGLQRRGVVVERTNDYGGQRVTLPSGATYDLTKVYIKDGTQKAIWAPSNDTAKNESLYEVKTQTHARVDERVTQARSGR
ncbi:MAG: hypothetical protein NEHIOOID_00200 [Holosporales bacterium]